MAEHHGPTLNTYIAIFLTLLGLTGLTVAVAFVDLGPFSAPIAVGIAGLKATLVVLFFMHVKYETRLIGLYAASGFVFLAILVVMTMGEYAGRAPQPNDVLGPPPLAQPASTAPASHP